MDFILTTLVSCIFRYLTALHIAADKAHYDVMDVLLKHGAKVRHHTFNFHYKVFILVLYLKCVCNGLKVLMASTVEL